MKNLLPLFLLSTSMFAQELTVEAPLDLPETTPVAATAAEPSEHLALADPIIPAADVPNIVSLATSSPSFNQPQQKNSFNYIGMGVTGIAVPIVPDVSVGYRSLGSHHSWDINGGVCAVPLKNNFAMGYVQSSYLYFPTPSSGFYIGAGLTLGYGQYFIPEENDFYKNEDSWKKSVLPYVNLPFTIGHQYKSKDHHRFIQFQITPALTTTLSYGMGF